jgi:hypothetical protein
MVIAAVAQTTHGEHLDAVLQYFSEGNWEVGVCRLAGTAFSVGGGR